MVRIKLLLLGGGACLVTAATTLILFALHVFPDNPSQSTAVCVIIIGALIGLLSFGIALTRTINDLFAKCNR